MGKGPKYNSNKSRNNPIFKVTVYLSIHISIYFAIYRSINLSIIFKITTGYFISSPEPGDKLQMGYQEHYADRSVSSQWASDWVSE